MYWIQKKTEPESLITERATHKKRIAESDYEVWRFLQAATKADIKRALIEEQRGVCCYCTSSVNASTCRVEHWESQSSEPRKRLDWSNLLAACRGGEGCPGGHHCDVLKGGRCVTANPQREGHVKSIKYDNSGRMSSSITEIQEDIDNVLGLNVDALMRARKSVLTTFLKQWVKKPESLDRKKRTRLAEKVRKLIDQNPATPFHQIILFYLTKDSNWSG